MILGLIVLALRFRPDQLGETYSFGTWQWALETDETKKQFVRAEAAFLEQLGSLGFVEDAAARTPDDSPRIYTCSVDEAEITLCVEWMDDGDVGLCPTWTYLATGPRAHVRRTGTKIDRLRSSLIEWLAAHERDHPMPE
jgi:hypothetical protein